MTRRALLSMLAAVPFVGRIFEREKTSASAYVAARLKLDAFVEDPNAGSRYFLFLDKGTRDETASGFYVWHDGAWAKRG